MSSSEPRDTWIPPSWSDADARDRDAEIADKVAKKLQEHEQLVAQLRAGAGQLLQLGGHFRFAPYTREDHAEWPSSRIFTENLAKGRILMPIDDERLAISLDRVEGYRAMFAVPYFGEVISYAANRALKEDDNSAHDFDKAINSEQCSELVQRIAGLLDAGNNGKTAGDIDYYLTFYGLTRLAEAGMPGVLGMTEDAKKNWVPSTWHELGLPLPPA